MSGNTELIKIRMDDGFAYAEIQKTDGYCEMGLSEKIYEVSSDYIKIASNMVKEIKEMSLTPNEIELEFSIGLKMVSSGLLSWLVANSSADAGVKVKLKWEKD